MLQTFLSKLKYGQSQDEFKKNISQQDLAKIYGGILLT